MKVTRNLNSEKFDSLPGSAKGKLIFTEGGPIPQRRYTFEDIKKSDILEICKYPDNSSIPPYDRGNLMKVSVRGDDPYTFSINTVQSGIFNELINKLKSVGNLVSEEVADTEDPNILRKVNSRKFNDWGDTNWSRSEFTKKLKDYGKDLILQYIIAGGPNQEIQYFIDIPQSMVDELVGGIESVYPMGPPRFNENTGLVTSFSVKDDLVIALIKAGCKYTKNRNLSWDAVKNYYGSDALNLAKKNFVNYNEFTKSINNNSRNTMKKITLNSKSHKLNSLVELVGQEVSVDNENEVIQSEVDSIKVTNDEVTLNLESGDQVVMDTEEAEELTETGEVATEVPTEPQDFEVTREVLDEDGNVDTVTSIVEAPTEDEAIQTIQTLDSKRKRNSRNYKATRKENSRPEGKEFKMAIGDDYIARFTTCPMGTLLKLELKKSDETNDKFVEVETSWIGKELSMNDAFTAAEEAIEKLSK